jgi:hypothetical protein
MQGMRAAHLERGAGGGFSGSRIRWCERRVLVRCGSHPAIHILLEKTRMALYRILPFISFPTDHAGSCLVDRRAMPPLTTTPSPDLERCGNGTRKPR